MKNEILGQNFAQQEEFAVEETNKKAVKTVGDKKTILKEYVVITIGIFLASLAIYFFMIPGNIIFGSITGLAMILVNFIPVQVSVMTFILNMICLVIGFVFVGREFGAKTVYTSILMPVFQCQRLVRRPGHPGQGAQQVPARRAGQEHRLHRGDHRCALALCLRHQDAGGRIFGYIL